MKTSSNMPSSWHRQAAGAPDTVIVKHAPGGREFVAVKRAANGRFVVVAGPVRGISSRFVTYKDKGFLVREGLQRGLGIHRAGEVSVHGPTQTFSAKAVRRALDALSEQVSGGIKRAVIAIPQQFPATPASPAQEQLSDFNESDKAWIDEIRAKDLTWDDWI